MRFQSLGMLALAAVSFAAAPVSAQTLYKLIDKSGKVTYSEAPPKPGEFDGQVLRIDVDPKANTATLPKGEALKAPPQAPVNVPPALREARVKLDIARRKLEEARSNPGPDDMQRIGNVGGGARAVPSEAYQKRIAELEESVRKAEEEVRRAEPPPAR
jgi:hypothetical protein